MISVGRGFILVGGVLIGTGLLITLAARFGIRPGRLPGDFVWRGKHMVFYFPLGTCIVISIIFSLLTLLFRRR